jgi:hypothetical protein
MPQVPFWDRECTVQKGLDHVELLRNELYCPFCRLKNPTPPKAVVQTIPTPGSSKAPSIKEEKFEKKVFVIPDDDESEPIEPTLSEAIKITNRWRDTQPDRTTANNERLIKQQKEDSKNTFTKFYRDAGNLPVSMQDSSGVPTAGPGLQMFKVTVQPIIGRYTIDEDDPDHHKTWTWRRHSEYLPLSFTYNFKGIVYCRLQGSTVQY